MKKIFLFLSLISSGTAAFSQCLPYLNKGELYSLTPDQVDAFRKDFPDAVKAYAYQVGLKYYTIPFYERNNFLNNNPSARLAFIGKCALDYLKADQATCVIDSSSPEIAINGVVSGNNVFVFPVAKEKNKKVVHIYISMENISVNPINTVFYRLTLTDSEGSKKLFSKQFTYRKTIQPGDVIPVDVSKESTEFMAAYDIAKGNLNIEVEIEAVGL